MTMRNRKTIITCFVLLACMLIGVGYAAVTGSLNITGATLFYSADETGANVHSAIKFSDASVPALYKDVCTTSLTGDDTADLTVTFVDTDKDTTDTVYDAVAKYTVIYESADANLPEATFSVPTLTLGGSACDYTFYLDEALSNEWDGSDVVKLAPNATAETFDFWVKVTYTETGTETGILKAFPQIALNYSAE